MQKKVMFNPPPGWVVQESGWIPSVSWQPPADWPPVPPGWPLFYVRRTWLPMVVFYSCLCLGVAGYAWLMAKAGHPLTRESYGLVAVFVLAVTLGGRVPEWKKAPPTKWPWLPHHPGGPTSAVTELRVR